MFIIVKFSSLFLSFLSLLSSLLIFFCNKSLNLSSKFFSSILTFFFDFFFLFTPIKLFTFNKLILLKVPVCPIISSSSSLLEVGNIFKSILLTLSSKEDTKVIINKKKK